MQLQAFNSLETAYKFILSDIAKYGLFSSPRGRDTKEIIGGGFTLTNPTNRMIGNPARKLNIFYAIGNFLWVMAQSNDLAFIEYYNPRGRNFSDDGKILRGAYGKRIFDFDGINQYHQAVRELMVDKDSRRALINIHMGQHDWSGSLDTPCTSDFHFIIREGQLHCINHMRSQSVAMVMPYDIFLMTMIHEYTAIKLGVELGEYQHFCNSMHFYNAESYIVSEIIESKVGVTKQQDYMPESTNDLMLKTILFFEKELREETIRCKLSSGSINYQKWEDKLNNLSLPKYWNEICLLLIAHSLKYSNSSLYSHFVEDRLQNTVYMKFL